MRIETSYFEKGKNIGLKQDCISAEAAGCDQPPSAKKKLQ
jgi:hypothetical protein